MNSRLSTRLTILALLAFILIGIFGLVDSGVLAQGPAKSSFAVSALNLSANGQSGPSVESLANQLTALPWASAKQIEKPTAWNLPPLGQNRPGWINFVTVGFNEQSDAYAFMFEGTEGRVSLAAHVSYRKVPVYGVLQWVWPTGRMIGSFTQAYQERDSSANRPLVHLRIVQARNKQPEIKKVDGGLKLSDARTLSPEQVMRQLEPMMFAAAYEAGFTPTLKPSSQSTAGQAICEVTVGDQSCSFRLKYSAGKRQIERNLQDVPWERYHGHLVRMFRSLYDEPRANAFTQLGSRSLEVLASEGTRIYGVADGELVAVDTVTGEQLWKIAERPNAQTGKVDLITRYDVRQDKAGKPHVYRIAGPLSEVDLDTGETAKIAPIAIDRPWAFAVEKEGSVVTVRGSHLHRHQGEKEIWNNEELYPVRCGPLLRPGQVIAGNDKGELFALDISSGKQIWRTTLPGNLYGPIIEVGKLLLAFSNAEEALIAVDASSGSMLWNQPLGDVLRGSPLAIGDQILAVTKANRLVVLNQSDGSIQAETTWPTWLVGVNVSPAHKRSLVVCADIEGAVTFLQPVDLRPVSKIALPTRPGNRFVFASKLPVRWAANKPSEDDNLLTDIGREPVAQEPTLLASDHEGFLYLLPIPGNKPNSK